MTRGISLQTYSSSSWELSIWVHMCSSGPHLYTVYLPITRCLFTSVAIEKIRPHSEVAKNWRPESGQEITTSNAWTQYWVHALLVVVWRPECGHHFVCAQKLCHRQWLRWRVCVCVQCVCVLIVHSVAIDTVGSRPFSDDWHAQCVWQSPVWQSGCMQ